MLQWNIYQSLLKIKAGTADVVPDAASACTWTDTVTYTCKLNPGLTFSNGDPLDANAVVYSFNRVVKINDPNGPSSLLSSMKSVAAQGTDTVVFTLTAPNSVFPYILTTGAGNIVDPKVFPADKLLPDGPGDIGSGVYTLSKYTANQQAVLTPNPKYKGDDVLANKRLHRALRADAGHPQARRRAGQRRRRVAQPEPDRHRLAAERDEQGQGREGQRHRNPLPGVQHLATAGQGPRDPPGGRVLHRPQRDCEQRLQRHGHPAVLDGARWPDRRHQAYKDIYGAAPDPTKAKAVLAAAGVTTPVNITIWWTPSHYGAVSGDEYTEIKRELESTGLFKVTLQSAEWDAYSKAYPADQYAAFELGWFPDYPDADDYLAPFYVKGGFYKNHYDSPAIDALITQEEGETDATKRTAELQQIQTLAAKDVPTIPVWQGNQVAATGLTVTGVDKTFDPSYIFRMWLIGKS